MERAVTIVWLTCLRTALAEMPRTSLQQAHVSCTAVLDLFKLICGQLSGSSGFAKGYHTHAQARTLTHSPLTRLTSKCQQQALPINNPITRTALPELITSSFQAKVRSQITRIKRLSSHGISLAPLKMLVDRGSLIRVPVDGHDWIMHGLECDLEIVT